MNTPQSNTKIQSVRNWMLLCIGVVALAVVTWFYTTGIREREDDMVGVLPDGIEVISEPGRKLVLNKNRGYSLNTGVDWDVFAIDGSIVTEKLDNKTAGSSGVGGVGCRVTMADTQITDLNLFLKNKCEKDPDCEKFTVETYKENESVEVVKLFGSFMGSGDSEFYLKPQNASGTYDRLTIICSDISKQDLAQAEILPTLRRSQ